MKKDFTAAAAATVKESIETAQAMPTIERTERKPRKTYSEEEQAEFRNNHTTTGHKGVKMLRINMGFSDENYDFIKIMSRVRGQTLTEFVNDVMNKYREDHGEVYRKAIEFRESL